MNTKKNINKVKVARSFLKGQKTYDSQARVQHYVGGALVEMLQAYPQICFDNVLEIGCCTGNLTQLLVEKFPIGKLYLNDLVPDFFEDVTLRIKKNDSPEIIPQFGDIEELDFPQGLDLVISSATFQWLNDLEKLFDSIVHSLHEKGHLAFSIFGPGTLGEFREVTGIGLEYTPVGDILDLLEHNFHIEEEKTMKDQLFFSTPMEILRHLQATGVGGVQEHRWTRNSLKEFENAYYERFGFSSGVPVTYMSSYIVASKK